VKVPVKSRLFCQFAVFFSLSTATSHCTQPTAHNSSLPCLLVSAVLGPNYFHDPVVGRGRLERSRFHRVSLGPNARTAVAFGPRAAYHYATDWPTDKANWAIPARRNLYRVRIRISIAIDRRPSVASSPLPPLPLPPRDPPGPASVVKSYARGTRSRVS